MRSSVKSVEFLLDKFLLDQLTLAYRDLMISAYPVSATYSVRASMAADPGGNAFTCGFGEPFQNGMAHPMRTRRPRWLQVSN